MTNRELAERIVNVLFTNGNGDRAERLVLTIDGPPSRNLGGWSEVGAIDWIEKTLAKALAAQEPDR